VCSSDLTRKKGINDTEKPVTYDTRNYKEQLKTPAKILILDIGVLFGKV
jgi:hypothetical protein